MNRLQVLERYRQRIQNGDRIKLSTEERAFLVEDFVQQLQDLEDPDAIAQWCQAEIALLEEGYGTGTNSTTNYLSKYRNAIATAVEQGELKLTEQTTHRFIGYRQATGERFEATNHLAWSLMRYDNAVYIANRKATNVGNNSRQDHPQPFVPERFLDKAKELLQAEEAESLAVGIAAVTGRRHTEVAVSGRFALAQHPYVLTFDGQLKKDDPVAYSIVTLLPAKTVIAAIDRFRQMPQVQAMQGLSSEDSLVKNFRARVNSRVKQHFQRTEILPILPGFQSVSIHRLRGAYARMAIHYWLPNQGANEQRFLQFYLGHVEASEMRDAPNSNATTHYFGYCLVDVLGKPITARGIKLMANPPLPSPTAQQVTQQTMTNQRLEAIVNQTPTEAEAEVEAEEEQSMAPTNHQFEAIALQLQDLPKKQRGQNQADQPPKAMKPKRRSLSVNLTDLSKAAQALGIQLAKGKGQGYQALLQQVLQAVAQTDNLPGQSSPSQAEDFSRSLPILLQEMNTLRQQLQEQGAEKESVRLLALEVASLREQVQQLTTEREHLQRQIEQLAPLQQECEQLRGQLQLATDRLSQFRLLAQEVPPFPPQQPDISSPPPEPTSQIEVISLPIPDPGSKPPHTRSAPQAAGLEKLTPDERIPLAIQALFRFNEAQPHPRDRWFISANAIADASGTNPATKVKPWLQQHPQVAQAIEQHNLAMQTTQIHHNRGKDKAQLKSIYQQFGES